jgi:hypothetical protein
MTLAYYKGFLNDANPLSQRPNFVPTGKFPLFWDGEVTSHAKLRRKSQMLLQNAQLNIQIVTALRLSPEFADLVHKGYSQNSFYGDEDEWTRDSRIEAIKGYFWRLDRLCIPRNSELRLRLICELYGTSSSCRKGVDGTLAKALDRFY